MHPKQDIVVERDRLHLGESFLDAFEGGMHRIDRDIRYELEKHDAQSPAHDREQNALSAFARDDEIRLHISDTFPLFDDFRPFIDENAFIELFRFSHPASSRLLFPFPADEGAMRTLKIPYDRVFRDVRQASFLILQSSGDGFRRLVVTYRSVHEVPEYGILRDFLSTIACVMPSYVRLVLRLLWIVCSVNRIALYFLRQTGDRAIQDIRDTPKRAAFP